MIPFLGLACIIAAAMTGDVIVTSMIGQNPSDHGFNCIRINRTANPHLAMRIQFPEGTTQNVIRNERYLLFRATEANIREHKIKIRTRMNTVVPGSCSAECVTDNTGLHCHDPVVAPKCSARKKNFSTCTDPMPRNSNKIKRYRQPSKF